MVGSERRNTDFYHHGFEEQEEMIGKSEKVVSMQEILDNLASDLESSKSEANVEVQVTEDDIEGREEGEGSLLYGKGKLTKSTSEKSHRVGQPHSHRVHRESSKLFQLILTLLPSVFWISQ